MPGRRCRRIGAAIRLPTRPAASSSKTTCRATSNGSPAWRCRSICGTCAPKAVRSTCPREGNSALAEARRHVQGGAPCDGGRKLSRDLRLRCEAVRGERGLALRLAGVEEHLLEILQVSAE